MSNPHLPAETLDHIVNHLHDTRDALRNCCLVSKSWVPRSRKHLFAEIKFYTTKSLRSWKNAFPDPANSPMRYVTTLSVRCPEVVADADADAAGWIRGFSRVVHLTLNNQGLFADPTPLVLSHEFSPVIKSLRVYFTALPSSQATNLILSFPLLEDLAVTTSMMSTESDDGSDRLLTSVQPPGPPMLTGTLELRMRDGMAPIIHWLLSLPDGIHFRELTWTWFREGDHLSTMALVEGCSYTLESLDIGWHLLGTSTQHLRPQRYLTSISRQVEVSFY
jgi:hypothetical protein